jgi:HK97 family phage prohead protease
MNDILAITSKINTRDISTSSDESNSIEVKVTVNDATSTDQHGTRFAWTPECVRETGNPIVLWNHDTDSVIGRVTSLQRAKNGSLEATLKIDTRTVMANGMTHADAIREGYVDGVSFRFDADAKFTRGNQFDTIEPNFLPEVSIVSLPSNRSSTIEEFIRSHRSGKPARNAASTTRTLEPDVLAKLDRRNTRAAGVLNMTMLYARLEEAVEDMPEYKSGWDDAEGEYNYGGHIASVYDEYVIVSMEWGVSYCKHGYSVDANGIVTIDPVGVDVLPTWSETGMTDARLKVTSARAVNWTTEDLVRALQTKPDPITDAIRSTFG